jgi:glutamate---cysteine ligase / carboxylate-amine ligase
VAPSIGVEEEYLLLDPDSGLPVPVSRQVRAIANQLPGVGVHEFEAELLEAQVEVATPVCANLDEVAAHLTRLRNAIAIAAAGEGCRPVASGTAPLRGAGPPPVTASPRYRRMSDDAPQLVDEQLINGMHVHVAIPDRDSGVGALNRIRPWLPALVALGANSPMWEGGDSGFDSWRTVVFSRWPVSGPPPVFADAADYRRRIDALLETGAIRDCGQVYWQARLSARYPTLEVRALDVQLRVQDAVTLAGLVRALVAQALTDERDGLERETDAHELVAAVTWQAARRGLAGTLRDPRDGRPAGAEKVLEAMLAYVGPALSEAGDLERVASGVRRLISDGTGAQRQRGAFRDHGLRAVLDLMTIRG